MRVPEERVAGWPLTMTMRSAGPAAVPTMVALVASRTSPSLWEVISTSMGATSM